MRGRFGGRVAVALAVVLLAAACGGGDDDEPVDGNNGSGGETSSIESFDQVEPAVVQIIAQGTFRDPEVGYADGSGAGSGFIISPDGLVVTNNHVVAGAATLEVLVGDESFNASILGVSECNDLALIDISESDPLPFLSWDENDISAGLEVYAAGFPLGEPEFTLTRGIISKAEADGDITGSSSIDHTIEHDANLQPGNSGGPLVSADGKVVGINYAGRDATSTAQFYAIAHDLAEPVIDKLHDGDFESLGINGWAVFDDDLGISGIWVAGVTAGSPASEAKILPGDILTAMNGLPIGTDGTFADYCDVIRTANGSPIAVEVLRYDSGEFLRGEINGGQPVEPVFQLSSAVEEQSSFDEPSGDSAPTTYSRYVEVFDDTGTIIVEVPAEWSDIDTQPIVGDNGEELPYIAAATDLNGFFDTFTTSGMVFAKLPPGDIDGALAEYAFTDDCIDLGVADYEDPLFSGKYQVWDECGGNISTIVVLAAEPDDQAYTALMIVQLVTSADFDALDQLFSTFDVFD